MARTPRDGEIDPHGDTLAPTAETLAATAETLAPAATSPSAPTRPGIGSVPQRVSLVAGEIEERGFDARYELKAPLGRGGMGVVHLCHDDRIGRDVAMKVMRADSVADDDLRARFLREVRVQGQLEHPAIVPVYDLGTASNGEAYFTMKRVRGRTLESVVHALAHGDPATTARFTRRRLLSALGNVCLAIDFAHSRGVVHRDLKPANVMLGDFGEVYVLDWGIAKLSALDEPDALPRTQSPELGSGVTSAGSVLGTPGFAAPEQVRGESATASSDVYALGAILFEVLTLQPLHAPASPIAMVADTLRGVEARCSVRAPASDVPPELEAICVRATALAPCDRFGSARELSEAIERYLDGDRDLERRRQLADEHAARAEREANRAADAGAHAADARRAALREVGQALGLTPSHGGAMQTLMKLLSTPPREPPAEVEREMADWRSESTRASGRAAVSTIWGTLMMIPMLLYVGVRSWTAFVPVAAMAAAALWNVLVVRRARPGATDRWIALALWAFATSSLAALWGWAVLVPLMATTLVFSVGIVTPPRQRWIVGLVSCLALVAPLGLELAGVVPAAYRLEHGLWTVVPRAIELPPLATVVTLAGMHVGAVISAMRMAERYGDGVDDTQRRLLVYRWQLRQLVPSAS